MDNLKAVKTPVLKGADPLELRERVRDYFFKSYSIDEKIFEVIARDEAFYLRPDPLRHPLIFYFGHTAVFYMNKLNIAGIVNKRINPKYESMFAVGVDEMSWDDLNEAHYDWPKVDEVRAYRDEVRKFVNALISDLPLPEGGIDWDSPWWAIMMGAEHQRIHLETSSVLIRQLPLDMVQETEFFAICQEDPPAPENELLPVPGGKISLGKSRDSALYGWDNEYGHKEFELADFKASRYLVSNHEFLQFIEAGAYHEPSFWTEEGWAWKSYQQAEMPRFWRKREDGSYYLRTIAREIPLPLSHPVEINYLEAKAFCNWKTKVSGKPIRLPTEAEWYRLRDLMLETDQPYWDKAPGNINLEYYGSACPVNRFAFQDFYDIIGNVWQWTETPISAFPGFRVHPYYDDFSVPTFDGRHNLIKGGSFISTGNEAIRDSRYAFRRHFYQHAGFRYVESDAPLPAMEKMYEDDPGIVPYCDLDWDSSFATQMLKLVQDSLGTFTAENVLNIGCKTGRLTFELARRHHKVTGIDFSARLIQLATGMKEDGYLRYSRVDEGEITRLMEPSLTDYGLENSGKNIEFWQADISNLAPKFNSYDLVVAVNAISEARDPVAFLQDLPQRLLAGAYLVFADSYHFSSREKPGGIRKDGEPYRAIDWLKDTLSPAFDLVGEHELTQSLWRDSRSAETRLLHITVWKKAAK